MQNFYLCLALKILNIQTNVRISPLPIKTNDFETKEIHHNISRLLLNPLESEGIDSHTWYKIRNSYRISNLKYFPKSINNKYLTPVPFSDLINIPGRK